MSGVRPTFDLQSHSRHSDGEFVPAEVVSAAASAGVELLALTDHDTVDGVSEAVAAAERIGIGLVPAVEISAVDEAGPDLHILGYLIDERDPMLRERLERYREDREHRTQAMVAALREVGFELDDEPLERRARAGKPIGRPHIARAVVTHPGNAKRLDDEGLTEAETFLGAYLVRGRPGFRSRRLPNVAQAIDAIHDGGGVAVWAHPFWDIAEPREVLAAIDRFRAEGIDGVECFYLTHTREQTTLLAGHCAETGLLSTGSSDFHGPRHPLLAAFRSFSTYGLSPRLGPIASYTAS
jgi:predicted metal-dependent phosphoesterase TrpH